MKTSGQKEVAAGSKAGHPSVLEVRGLDHRVWERAARIIDRQREEGGHTDWQISTDRNNDRLMLKANV